MTREMLIEAVARGVVELTLLPLNVGYLWLIQKLGFFEWARLPALEIKQMFVICLLIMFIA